MGEVQRLLHAELELPDGPAILPDFADRVALYLLVSELHFDLPSGIPSALAGVPHADVAHHEQVLTACDRWRDTDEGRESYVLRARQVERDLRL